MACIYKIENKVNGKIYIGSTVRPFYIRKYEHLSSLRDNIHYNSYLQRSFNKYGEDNFEFIIIEEFKFPKHYNTLTKAEYLVCREMYLCKLIGVDYNMRIEATTGKSGYKHSKETRKKISEGILLALEKQGKRAKPKKAKIREQYAKGWVHTDEAISKIRERSLQEDNKQRIRLIQKKATKNWTGKHCSVERKINIVKGKFGYIKPICIYNKNNQLLYTCNFSTDAHKLTGVHRSSISNNLCGISKSTRDYIFKYKTIDHEFVD